MTFDALIHANALYANGAMRRWWGLKPSIEQDGAAAKVAKAALARGFKFMNSRKAFREKTGADFRGRSGRGKLSA